MMNRLLTSRHFDSGNTKKSHKVSKVASSAASDVKAVGVEPSTEEQDSSLLSKEFDTM